MHIIRTGEQSYCLIGCWLSREVMVEAMAAMNGTLNSFRITLEDQGPGKGVTDVVSGFVVLDLKAD